MTRLLVSVRSLDEAQDAFAAGAHLIDLKEPSGGSLGRVPDDVALAVSRRLGKRRTLSMALGELADLTEADERAVPEGIAYAKLGLAGCAARDDWPARWRRALHGLPTACGAVAVAYADWKRVSAPSPDCVLREAVSFGCRALLVDTCDKAAGNIFDHWPIRDVARFVDRVRGQHLLTVLAGSLTVETAPAALSCLPDYLAVRGAVCDGGRQSVLVRAKVRHWVEMVTSERGVG
jgi:(5-formylfuran-3-yl)methyl phosphate synthase